MPPRSVVGGAARYTQALAIAIWHYDLLLVAMSLVIATTGGGSWVLF